jgi:shikimate 5-dehydrogenase
LLFLAQMQGCQTINGRRPLQHQAALSRELWLRQLQLSGEKREC